MGGYDIFRCSYDLARNNFGPVSNLDYKINSTDDDILYIVDDNNENAFFLIPSAVFRDFDNKINLSFCLRDI